MTDHDLIFEESLSDDWAGDLEIIEVPLDNRPLIYAGFLALAIGLLIGARVFYLNVVNAGLYSDRADTNAGKYERESAPRGLIVDRNGEVLAENAAVFSAYLNPTEYVRNKDLQEPTRSALEKIFGISPEQIDAFIREWDPERSGEPLPVAMDISQEQLVSVRSLNLPTISAKGSFRRSYPDGQVFSSVVGYVGLTTPKDLAENGDLSHQDLIGKTGLEAGYDAQLQGRPGMEVKLRNASGKVLDTQPKTPSQIGKTLKLVLDGEFQKYFYSRMSAGLRGLGRTSGVGLAMDPRNGQVLALINFPTFDNNAFNLSERNSDRKEYLSSENKPLFSRAVAGEYSPGSTIKPLVGVAALTEKVIDPHKSIFSPGYLDVPNPYDPAKPTRFLDWQYQGYVNLYSAIAQSSDVYFYEVGGGFGDQVGLGINRLRSWWQKFGFGQPTGIDLPGEKDGFLPSIDWKKKATGRNWLVGDTYNVSIGQGDLTVTPIQLLNYISSIANGGILYRPTLNSDLAPAKLADLTGLAPAIKEAQKGMRLTVTSPKGTAYKLNDLPFEVAAKTGSAQINNNLYENAFFAGYIVPPGGSGQGADTGSPLAILVLVEKSKEGSLNAVPIAKDVLNWYYLHRTQWAPAPENQ